LQADEDEGVRRHAAIALGQIGDEEAIVALRTALRTDDEESVRQYATEALGKIGSDEAIPGLWVALRGDEDDWVRQSAAEALREIAQKHRLRIFKDGGSKKCNRGGYETAEYIQYIRRVLSG